MIKDLVQRKTLEAQVVSWVGLAEQVVQSLERNDADAPKLIEKGWTLQDARVFLEFIRKAESELRALPPVEAPDDEDDSDGVAIESAPNLSALQALIEKSNLDANLVVRKSSQGAVGSRAGVTEIELADAAKPPTVQKLFYSPFDEPGVLYITEGAKAVAYRMLHGRHEFIKTPPSVGLANKAKLIIVGDWGSGVGRALDVAALMRKEIDNRNGVETHVIHLGDIYFAGWPDEVKKRFLDVWPVRVGEAGVFSWCLNGNHDMYCGGDGYFDHVLKDPRFAQQGGCSYFAFGNSFWQFLGLDTAYDEWNLNLLKDGVDQVAWAQSVLNSNPSARGVLLSHHQPRTAYDKEDAGKEGKIARQSLPLLQSGRVQAWLWGHEHRCVLYKPVPFNIDGQTATLPFGACLGHGGVPTRPTRGKKPGVYSVLEEVVKYGLENFGMMGFAVLDLDGASAKLRCITEKGEVHFNESIA